ncbi:MAG TPA: T9SS type A sorting domain-containing protein, partial [Chitinophagales bacterium]
PYPNPAHDHICMDFEDTPPSNLKMEIYSVNGQLVSSQTNLSQHAKTSVAGLASGSYTLVISHNGNQKGYNFVVR